MPPASLPARGGGALRGAARRERPRPARLRRRSQSPGCTSRPPPTTTSRPASPPPAAARSRVTPTRRGARPQPLARGAAPTWLPPAAPPALPFPARAPLRSRHPGRRALPAGPARSRRARPSGGFRTRPIPWNKVGHPVCSPSPEQVVVAMCETVSPNLLGAGTRGLLPRTQILSPWCGGRGSQSEK